jgi:hypothetical protein
MLNVNLKFKTTTFCLCPDSSISFTSRLKSRSWVPERGLSISISICFKSRRFHYCYLKRAETRATKWNLNWRHCMTLPCCSAHRRLTQGTRVSGGEREEKFTLLLLLRLLHGVHLYLPTMLYRIKRTSLALRPHHTTLQLVERFVERKQWWAFLHFTRVN